MKTPLIPGAKRVQRKGIKLLLVPEIYNDDTRSNNDPSACTGCHFYDKERSEKDFNYHCPVRWKEHRAGAYKDGDTTCCYNSSGVGFIYILPEKRGEYVATLVAMKLEEGANQ